MKTQNTTPQKAEARAKQNTRTNDNGLFVDSSTNPSTCLGYIFNFNGHGAFAPDGKVEASQEQIDEHNALLSRMELGAMRKQGRATLYLMHVPSEKRCWSDSEGTHYVEWQAGTWASKFDERFPCYNVRKSRNNFGAERIDVDFNFDGSRWHGVNVGDNEILRVKRCKS